MSSANLTREETAARAAGIRLHTVEVDLDLRSAPDAAATTFPTRSTFAFTAVTDTTWVDFIGESVIEVIVNDRAQPVEWDGARIRLRGLVADGATPNVVRIDAAARTARPARVCTASATPSMTPPICTPSTSLPTAVASTRASSSRT
jgi:aminopeptidase N